MPINFSRKTLYHVQIHATVGQVNYIFVHISPALFIYQNTWIYFCFMSCRAGLYSDYMTIVYLEGPSFEYWPGNRPRIFMVLFRPSGRVHSLRVQDHFQMRVLRLSQRWDLKWLSSWLWRHVGYLPQHYTESQLRRPRYQSYSDLCWWYISFIVGNR
jgi:hypothetical protein